MLCRYLVNETLVNVVVVVVVVVYIYIYIYIAKMDLNH